MKEGIQDIRLDDTGRNLTAASVDALSKLPPKLHFGVNESEYQDCDACTVATEPISPSTSCSDSDVDTDSNNVNDVGMKRTKDENISKALQLELRTKEKPDAGKKELFPEETEINQHKPTKDELLHTEGDDKSREAAATNAPSKGEKKTSTNASTAEQIDSQPQLLQIAAQKFQFEAKYSGLAATTFLCYCVAHVTIYDFIYTILLELTENAYNSTLVYTGLLVVGLLLLRSTGFLFYFLAGKRYRASRKEIQEGLQRGSWDARFNVWIEHEDREIAKTVLEVIGFYLCYISIYFFWNHFLVSFVDQSEELFKLLPSTQHRLLSDLADDGVSASITNATTSEEGTCETPINWESEDSSFIYRNVAKTFYYQYNGHDGAPLMSAPMALLVSGGVGALSIVCLSQLGYAFVDSWS